MCQEGVMSLETAMVSVNTIHVKHHLKDKHTSPNTHTLCAVQLKCSEGRLINYQLSTVTFVLSNHYYYLWRPKGY